MKTLLIMLLLSCPLWATTYYVSNAGNNASAGTDPTTAFAFSPGMVGCSATCAGVTLAAGDNVLFRQGDTWRDTLTVGSSGTAGALITYNSYVSASSVNPIITGSDAVSGFANGGSNIWDKTSFTTQPFVVIVNGALGTKKGSRAACTTPGDWFWVANTLSVFSTVDPSGNVQAAQRNNAISLNGKNFLSVNNLTLYGTNSFGMSAVSSNSVIAGVQSKWHRFGGYQIRSANNTVFLNDDGQANGITGFTADSNDSNLTFIDCTASLNVGDGLFLDGVVGATVIGGNFSNNGNASSEGNGIDILQEANAIPSSSITITGVTASNNFGSGIDAISPLLGDAGNVNLIIQGSTFCGNLNGASLASGIRLDDNTNNTIIRYNVSCNNGSAGIVFEGQAHHNSILYNIVYGNANGITQSNVPGCNNIVLGNVAYANTSDGFQLATGGCANVVENNIWYANLRYGYNTDGSVVDTVDYNISFGNVTNNYNGIAKPTHDINSDPLFLNPAGHDFRVKANSPAIDAGLAQIYQYRLGLSPLSVYSSTTMTLDQTLFGTGWEIGAFVNVPSYQPQDGRVH